MTVKPSCYLLICAVMGLAFAYCPVADAQCGPITGLTCEYDPTIPGVLMTWTNNGTYSTIDVVCDGNFVTSLPGSATSYVYLPTSSAPTICCELRASIPGAICGTTECCFDLGPCQPINVNCDVDPASGSVVFTWANTASYAQIDIVCNGTVVASLPGGANSYTLTGLSPGDSGCCRIVGILADGTVCPSQECCYQLDGCLPITNLTCSQDAMGVVTLSWTNNSPYTQIRIECDGVPVAALPGTATTFSFPSSTQVNCCTVTAFFQGVICSQEECCPDDCVPPSDVTCDVDPATGAVIFNWVNNGAYASIDIDCNGVVVASLPGNATTFALTGLNPGDAGCCRIVVTLADGTVCVSGECCYQIDGCLPITDLTCTQDPMGGLVFNWTNNSPYSNIQIECDGIVIATLPGTATTFSTVVPAPVQCCVVTAFFQGVICSEEECCPDLCLPPSNLICGPTFDPTVGTASLSWVNNSAYASIEIYCDGVLQATLPGTSTSHLFSPPSTTDPICCRVVGILASGLACSSVECCFDLGPCEPTQVTCMVDPLTGQVIFNWVNNAAYGSLDIVCNGVLIATLPGTDTTYTLTGLNPGDSGCCQIVATLADGTTCVSQECCYQIDGCLPITDLTCFVDSTGAVTLNWTNNSPYTAIEISCDGVGVATLPGTDTSFTFAAPAGIQCCRVRAVFLGIVCSEEECCPEDVGPCPFEDLTVDISTGFDQLNGLLSPGDLDDDWIVIQDSDTSGNPFVPPFLGTSEPTPAQVRTPNGAWAGPLPGSQWVFNSVTNANGFIDYQLCFCLRDGFSNPVLALEILADDSAEVFLNGFSIGSTTGAFTTPTPLGTADATLFNSGLNCIVVRVENSFGVDTGFNLSGQVTADDGRCCCVPPPNGMTAWWPLDELVGGTSRDIAGLNNGQHMGNTPLPREPEFVDHSLDFDGMSFVRVNPVNNALDFGPSVAADADSGDFSIDAWIRGKQIFTVNPIVSKLEPGGRGYTFFMYENKRLALEIRDGGSTVVYVSDTGVPPTFGNLFQLDTWYHVTVTVDRDATNGVKFYVNGYRADDNLQDPTAQLGSLVNDAPLFIGHALDSSYLAGQHFFQGNIDEVEIFGRALNAGEVRSLAEARRAGKCKERCHVPWDKPVPGNGTVTVGVTVCNDSLSPQTYNITSSPLFGQPGCSTAGPVNISHMPMITVPAGGCVTFPVTLVAPAAGGISCYEMCFENVNTGHRFCCRGSLVVGPPIVVIGNDNPIVIDVLVDTPITFPVSNPGQVPFDSTFRVVPMPGNMNGVITPPSLNGGPPGMPVSGMLSLNPGGGMDITVEALVADHEPFVFYDIILMVDLDGDGDEEAVASATIRTAAPVLAPQERLIRGDCNGDGVVDIADVINLLGILFGGSGSTTCQDACDTNDDGFVNIADGVNLLDFLFNTGSIPAPFPRCGVDPTADSLDCVSSSCP